MQGSKSELELQEGRETETDTKEKTSQNGMESLQIPSKETIIGKYHQIKQELVDYKDQSNVKENTESFDAKEQICQQGGLHTLLTILNDEDYLHKKLLLIEIISKLVLKNSFAKKQFKEIGGYLQLISLFDSLSEKHFSSPHSLLSIEVRKSFRCFWFLIF